MLKFRITKKPHTDYYIEVKEYISWYNFDLFWRRVGYTYECYADARERVDNWLEVELKEMKNMDKQ